MTVKLPETLLSAILGAAPDRCPAALVSVDSVRRSIEASWPEIVAELRPDLSAVEGAIDRALCDGGGSAIPCQRDRHNPHCGAHDTAKVFAAIRPLLTGERQPRPIALRW